MTRILRRETRRRGFFGQIFKWLFIAFNALIAPWLFLYWKDVGHLIGDATSDAARTGGAIGATLATGFLISLWAAGDIILGLFVFFTRGKLTTIEERVE